jgi:hypothetical protein
MKPAVVVTLLALLAPACYLRPSHVAAPAPTAEGVRVTLVGDDCDDHRGVDGDPVSRDLGVKVQFDNPTNETLTISEERIRLVVDGDTAGPHAPEPQAVAPHSSRQLALDFTHHALCNRDRPFTLTWNGALTLGQRPVQLAALVFSP